MLSISHKHNCSLGNCCCTIRSKKDFR